MARTRIYIDIKTIPSQAASAHFEIAKRIKPPAAMKKPATLAAWEANEKPGLVEEAYLKTAFDGSVGHIVSVGFAVGGKTVESFTWTPDPEDVRSYADVFEAEYHNLRGALMEINGMLEGEQHPQLVAHHAAFDLRFIQHRAVVLGITLPSWWPRDLKPWGPDVMCRMTAWAGVGQTVGLDRLCRALGIQGKGDVDGSQVYDFWRRNQWETLRGYNLGVVERLRSVATRNLAAYGEAA